MNAKFHWHYIFVWSCFLYIGLLIAKFKCMGGMPYNVLTRLYDSSVWSVISYGASVWGTKSYSCITAVQNRAMRLFLGTGKYTPNAAVSGDLRWQSAHIRQWKSVFIYWNRIVHICTKAALTNRVPLERQKCR